MTAWGAVADSLAYLVETFGAIENVRTIDGQPLEEPTEPDVLVVGYDPDRNAASTSLAPQGLDSEVVTFDLACLASSWRGNTDAAEVRTAVVTLLDAVASAIDADRTLGGAVLDARLELLDFDQQQGPGGAFATVAFTVRARTFA